MFFTGVVCVCVCVCVRARTCACMHINADNIKLSYSLLLQTTVKWDALESKKKLKE